MCIHFKQQIMEQPFEATQEVNSRLNIRSRKNRRKSKKAQTQITINNSLQNFASSAFYQEIKQCRICLDCQNSKTNELSAPCNCIGSVRYVHHDCFKEWIIKRVQRQNPAKRSEMIKDGMLCELCKSRVYLQFKKQIICNQKQVIYGKINLQLSYFFISLIVIVIQITFISFLLGYFHQLLIDFKSYLTGSLVVMTVAICLLISLSILFYKFTATFLISQVSILHNFHKNKTKSNDKRAKKMRVHPQNIQNLQ